MSYLVKDYMDEDFPTIIVKKSVRAAAKAIKNGGKGFLIVLEEGKPKGIVTERDFVNKVIAEGLDPDKVHVSEIMSCPLIKVDPDEDLIEASKVMRKHSIRRLPVVKNDIIYGVITTRDIVNHVGEYVDKTIKDILMWTPFTFM
jgi:CBS domain-containing protein